MEIRPHHIATFCLGTALVPGTPAAVMAETLAGPVEARVLRVIDGDTFVAEARIWPGQTVTVSVRLRGIDAPEIRSRCAAEKAAGERSREALQRLIGTATVKIRNITGGKYYGRVLADVATPGGEPVAAKLLKRALVRPYGGGRRKSACG